MKNIIKLIVALTVGGVLGRLLLFNSNLFYTILFIIMCLGLGYLLNKY